MGTEWHLDPKEIQEFVRVSFYISIDEFKILKDQGQLSSTDGEETEDELVTFASGFASSLEEIDKNQPQDVLQLQGEIELLVHRIRHRRVKLWMLPRPFALPFSTTRDSSEDLTAAAMRTSVKELSERLLDHVCSERLMRYGRQLLDVGFQKIHENHENWSRLSRIERDRVKNSLNFVSNPSSTHGAQAEHLIKEFSFLHTLRARLLQPERNLAKIPLGRRQAKIYRQVSTLAFL
ncbi:hypothetical protein T439DRAFT_357850 [Meredithblackwellia eburnea MCA 4105]